MTAEATAICVAPNGVSGALLAMIERLQGSGVLVHVADDLGGAAELASRVANSPPAILLDLQQLSAAAQTLDKCINRFPAFAGCHRVLGNVFTELKYRDEARAQYVEFLRLAPDAPEAEAVRQRISGPR